MKYRQKSLRHLFVGLSTVSLILLLNAPMCPALSWVINGTVDIGTGFVQVLADPARPYVYAIDRINSEVIFIDLNTRTVTNRLYVGQDPTSCDIDATGQYLYVANKGPGTGVPGSYEIAVIDLQTQQKVNSYILATKYINSSLVDAVNVTAGRNGRLYYNSGNDIWNYGDAGLINTVTGEDLSSFAAIKTKMVISSDKTRLYGQYVYDGNLGQMGVFDVSTDVIPIVDQLGYPPYASNYGWGPDNYTLSGNDQFLAFGDVYFNAKNLSQQYGVFDEYIYALNYDGTVAFGQSAIWDPTTFPIHGSATKIQDLPFTTTVMNFDPTHNVLYLGNTTESKLYILVGTCVTLAPSSTNLSADAASGGFAVQADNSCCWTAIASQSWIQLTSATTGCGTGTVAYTLTANTSANVRSGVISISGQSFSITQAGACSYTLSTTSTNHGATTASGSFTVQADTSCCWTAIASDVWIQLTSASTGCGTGTVAYTLTANTSTNVRSGVISVSGQSFSITQAGACGYALSTASTNHSAAAASGGFAVLANDGCCWTAIASQSWIQLTGATAGCGAGTVGYALTANTGANARSGTISVGGQSFSIAQAGACSFTLSAVSTNHSAVAAAGGFTVQADTSCCWTAIASQSWIQLISATTGCGTAPVSYMLAGNFGGTQRSGAISVGGQSFSITQDGACSYTFSTTSTNHGATAASGSFTVQADTSCCWTAITSQAWVQLTGATTGCGGGTVAYSISANTSTNTRAGTISVAGQSFSITQAGQAEYSPLYVSGLILRAKFNRVGSDTCTLMGSLTGLPANASIANAAVTLNVGDAITAFQLNARSRGVSRNGTIRFSFVKKTGTWAFTAKLKGDLKASWAKYSITSGIVINSDVTFPVQLTLQSDALESFGAELPLSYSNKSGTLGSATYAPVR